MKLLKVSFLLIVMTAIFFSCGGEDIPPPLTAEEQTIIDQEAISTYLNNNNIQALEDSVFGLRYTLNPAGSGDHPELKDTLNVSFEGRYLGLNTVIGGNDSVTLVLEDQMYGWQVLVPYLKEGGTIRMYLPRFFALGNRNLEFDLTLNEIVKN